MAGDDVAQHRVGSQSGNHMGTVTGPHQEGASITSVHAETEHVVPPTTLTRLPFTAVCVPSMRRQILLSDWAAAGFGRMKRCASVSVLVTPDQTIGIGPEYSTHDQINRSRLPPGIQL